MVSIGHGGFSNYGNYGRSNKSGASSNNPKLQPGGQMNPKLGKREKAHGRIAAEIQTSKEPGILDRLLDWVSKW